LAGFPIHNFHL